MPKNVCVVGAGVSGLTCAICIAEAGHTVEVFANEEGSSTTSSIAAAFWYPFWTGREPNHKWYKPEWAERTYEVLEALSATNTAGISRTSLFEYFSEFMSEDEIQKVIKSMWWKQLRQVAFRDLRPDELIGKSVRNPRFKGGITHFKSGIMFKTFVVNMSDYLRYLTHRLAERGVRPQRRNVTDLRSLAEGYDVVVNCSGIGAKKLVPDNKVIAKEGIVLQLTELKQIQDIFLIHTGDYFDARPMYIVPRVGSKPDIILGGTITSRFPQAQRKAFQPQHIPFDEAPKWVLEFSSRILNDCTTFESELENATVLNVQVGYRPARHPKVRLKRIGNVIHNYGHAGGGVTLSWGCAEEVLELLQS